MKFKDIPSDQLKKILTDKYGSLQTMDEKMDFISKLFAVEMTDPKHEFAKDAVLRNVFNEFRNEIFNVKDAKGELSPEGIKRFLHDYNAWIIKKELEYAKEIKEDPAKSDGPKRVQIDAAKSAFAYFMTAHEGFKSDPVWEEHARKHKGFSVENSLLDISEYFGNDRIEQINVLSDEDKKAVTGLDKAEIAAREKLNIDNKDHIAHEQAATEEVGFAFHNEIMDMAQNAVDNGKIRVWKDNEAAAGYLLSTIIPLAYTALIENGDVELATEATNLLDEHHSCHFDKDGKDPNSYIGYDAEKFWVIDGITKVKNCPKKEYIPAILEVTEKIAASCEKAANNTDDPGKKESYMAAVVAVREKGNLLRAVIENRMLEHIINDQNSNLKEPYEESVRGLKGIREDQKDLPEDQRVDIYEAFVTSVHASNYLIPVEYERQKMLAEGEMPERKEAYLKHLKEVNEKILEAYDVLDSVNDKGQYDRFIDNPLDHFTGKRETSRDRAHMMGYMRGQNRAIEMGWDHDELAVLGIVGSIEGCIKKAEGKLLYRKEKAKETADNEKRAAEENKIAEQEKELAAYKRAFMDMKELVWDRKVSGPSDKKQLTDMVSKFIFEHPSPKEEISVKAATNVFEEELDKVAARLKDVTPGPIFHDANDNKGKKLAWDNEGAALARQLEYNKNTVNQLDQQGKLPEYVKEKIDAAYEDEDKLPTFNNTWHNLSGSKVLGVNTQAGSPVYFSDAESANKGREALIAIRDNWIEEANRLPADMPGREYIRQMYLDSAFNADPYAGNFLKAELDHPYIAMLNSQIGSAPKFESMDPVTIAEGLGGRAPEQQRLEPGLRADIYSDYMGLLHSYNEELRLEYRKQYLEEGGWDETKEETYKQELKECHAKLLGHYRALQRVPDGGQYDRYLNNELDHSLGRNPENSRDVRSAIGYMEGELRAMELGWKSNEIAVLGVVGAMTEELDKKWDHFSRGKDSPEKTIELIEFEKDLRALKAAVWDKKAESAADKKAVCDMVDEFYRVHQKTLKDNLIDRTREHFIRTRDNLDIPAPKMSQEAKQEREERIEREKAEYEKRALNGFAEAYADERADRKRREEGIYEAAIQAGWPEERRTVINSLAKAQGTLEATVKALREKEKAFGEDHGEEIEKTQEALDTLSECLDEMVSKKIHSADGLKASQDKIIGRLEKYRGYVGAVTVALIDSEDAIKRNPLRKETLDRYKEARKETPAVKMTILNDMGSNLQSFARFFPTDTEEHRRMLELAGKVEDVLVDALANDARENMQPEYYDRFRQLCEDSLKELNGIVATMDHEKRPLASVCGEELILNCRQFVEGYDRVELGHTVAYAGYRASRSVMDILPPSEREQNGKSREEQQALIDKYEEAAAKNKDFFDMIKEGHEQERIGIGIYKDREAAKKNGTVHDESYQKEMLREGAERLGRLTEKVIAMAKDPDFPLAEHPYMVEKTLENVLQGRGTVKADIVIKVQQEMERIGEDPERAWFYNEAENSCTSLITNIKKSAAVLQGAPRIEGLIPDIENIRKCGSVEGAAAFREEAAAKGLSFEEYFYELTTGLNDKVKEILKDETLPKEEKDRLEEVQAFTARNMGDVAQQYRERFENSLSEPAVFAAAAADTVSAAALSKEEAGWFKGYFDGLSVPDQNGYFSPGKEQLIKNAIKGLSEKLMDELEAEGNLMSGGKEREERISAISDALDSLGERLKGREISGKDAGEYIRDVLADSLEEHKQNLAARLENEKDPEAAALKIINDGTKRVAANEGSALEQIAGMSRSTDTFLKDHAAQDDKLVNLQEYRAGIMDICDRAKGMLEGMDEDGVNEKKDSKEFTAMYNAVKAVAEMTDKNTPKEIQDAIMKMEETAEAYRRERDGDLFARFRGEKGQHRLGVSDEARNIAAYAFNELFIPDKGRVEGNLSLSGVDKEKPLNEIIKDAGKKLEVNARERERRGINLKELEEKDADEKIRTRKVDRDLMQAAREARHALPGNEVPNGPEQPRQKNNK